MASFKKMVVISETEYLNLKKLANVKKSVMMEKNTSSDINFRNAEKLNDRLSVKQIDEPLIEENEENGNNGEEVREEEEEEEEVGGGGGGEGIEKETNIENDLEELLRKAEQYFSKKETDKGVLLIKRLYATGRMKVLGSLKKIELGKHDFSFIRFIDFVQLCISRKRPHETAHESASFKTFITFLDHNEIPLNLISNPYVKTMIKDRTEFNDKSDRKKGSESMIPRLKSYKPLKSTGVVWFKSLDEVV